MKVVAKTEQYTIFQKRNERYAIRDAGRAWVNGDAKIAILLEHKLIDAPAPKAAEPEAPAAEAKPEAAEATAGEDTGPDAGADAGADESASQGEAEES